MKHDDGGPAYPVSFPSDWHEKQGGMSLLDAFAMNAMVGILRNLEGLRPDDIPLMARDAYGIAAAMVAEKSRREGGKVDGSRCDVGRLIDLLKLAGQVICYETSQSSLARNIRAAVIEYEGGGA